MRYEVLSPGKKVKKFRKLVGASQLEIIGQAKTRNAVSLIENGKQNLTYETAAIIAANINKIAKYKGIGMIELTPEYLIQKIDIEINSIADNYINDLKEIKLTENIEELGVVERDIEQYMFKYRNELSVDSKYKIYKLIAEIYLKRFQYVESEIYLLKAYDIAIRIDDINKIIQIIKMRIIIYSKTGRNTDTIVLCRHALFLVKNDPIDDYESMQSIYYNTALAYKYYNEYNNSILFLEKILDIPNLDKNVMINVQILRANCYLDNKDYEAAEEEYFNVLAEAKDNENAIAAIRIYRNLALCYLGMMEYEKAIKYTELTLSIKNFNIEEQALTLYHAVHAFKECNELLLVKRHLFHALVSLEKVNNTIKQTNLILDVTQYLLEIKETEYLEKLLIYILDRMNKLVLRDERLIQKAYVIVTYFERMGLFDIYRKYEDRIKFI